MQRPQEIVLIVATARDNVIGTDNQLPWHLPEDLAHFKQMTTGHCMIMGRKTFESIGRVLPNRRSIVVSAAQRSSSADAPAGVEWASSFETALSMSQREVTAVPGSVTKAWPTTPVFIIGGAQLYQQAMAIADRIEQTEVNVAIDGDAWFPAIDPQQWQMAAQVPAGSEQLTSRNGLGYRFLSWHRRRTA